MRLFIAAEISEEARTEATQRIELLQAKFSDLRVGWEKPEKLHLTLKFLGEVEEDKLPEVIQATKKAARQISPFELEIAGSGVFPVRGAARVLWLNITSSKDILQRLNQRLEDECYVIGFEREERFYTPHLTIARLREPRAAQELAKLHLATPFPPVSFAVGEIVVFQSQQTASGVIYRRLAKTIFDK